MLLICFWGVREHLDMDAETEEVKVETVPLKEAVPGDVNKIISNGTSAGGAMSSLLGSTGDHPDYEPYLKELGAAEESDAIYAASCYCPITNLDHADMA